MVMKMSFQLLLQQLHGTLMVLSELWIQGLSLFEHPLKFLVYAALIDCTVKS